MRKVIWLFIFGAVAIVLVIGIPYNRGPSEEEKQVLSAFQKIQSDLYESGPTDAFGIQVSTVENILARLKQANGSQCVVNVLERSMASYRLIQKIRDSTQVNLDERKKTDLQLALAVSMSACETGLKQALDCYK
jgi:hypothetical protein